MPVGTAVARGGVGLPLLRAAAVVALCALAAAGTSLALRRAPPAVARTPAEVRSVPGGEAASFAILRRPLRAGDAFAAIRAESGPVGANAALARTVRVPGAGAVSVVPANGWVCLRVPISRGGAQWWCETLPLARAGKLIIALRPPGPLRQGERQFLAGLVPDGVRSVAVTAAGGARRRVRVRSNLWSTLIDAPLTVTIAPPAGGLRRYPAP